MGYASFSPVVSNEITLFAGFEAIPCPEKWWLGHEIFMTPSHKLSSNAQKISRDSVKASGGTSVMCLRVMLNFHQLSVVKKPEKSLFAGFEVISCSEKWCLGHEIYFRPSHMLSSNAQSFFFSNLDKVSDAFSVIVLMGDLKFQLHNREVLDLQKSAKGIGNRNYDFEKIGKGNREAL